MDEQDIHRGRDHTSFVEVKEVGSGNTLLIPRAYAPTNGENFLKCFSKIKPKFCIYM
jgi:hypothetical protein